MVLTKRRGVLERAERTPPHLLEEFIGMNHLAGYTEVESRADLVKRVRRTLDMVREWGDRYITEVLVDMAGRDWDVFRVHIMTREKRERSSNWELIVIETAGMSDREIINIRREVDCAMTSYPFVKYNIQEAYKWHPSHYRERKAA